MAGSCLPLVSISLSSGFSFQVRNRAYRLSRLSRFQSRYRAASHFRLPRTSRRARYRLTCFNLVIERLLISGAALREPRIYPRRCFNLVIERLLISGDELHSHHPSPHLVSISLSSGFSFQVQPVYFIDYVISMFQSRYRAASHFRGALEMKRPRYSSVSISLSSGFSFQDT